MAPINYSINKYKRPINYQQIKPTLSYSYSSSQAMFLLLFRAPVYVPLLFYIYSHSSATAFVKILEIGDTSNIS